MTNNEFYSKYKNVVDNICKIHNVDIFTGCAMLRSTVKGHFGIQYSTPDGMKAFDLYRGIPDDFDYNAAIADVYK